MPSGYLIFFSGPILISCLLSGVGFFSGVGLGGTYEAEENYSINQSLSQMKRLKFHKTHLDPAEPRGDVELQVI